jgi:hypothetical protein
MTQFYVPEISDRFTLVSDWSFTLYGERRNCAMLDLLGLSATKDRAEARERADALKAKAYRKVPRVYPASFFNTESRTVMVDEVADVEAKRELDAIWTKLHCWPIEATLPAGTELQVDRIYIRKGLKDFSSITFYVVSSPKPELNASKKSRRRFWAKLSDCNRMEITREEHPQLALAS